MNELPAEIQALKARFDELNSKKFKTDAALEEKAKTLDDLKRTAKENFGTDDPEKLQALLQKYEAENLEMRRNYESLLNQIEAELKQIEDEYRETP